MPTALIMHLNFDAVALCVTSYLLGIKIIALSLSQKSNSIESKLDCSSSRGFDSVTLLFYVANVQSSSLLDYANKSVPLPDNYH